MLPWIRPTLIGVPCVSVFDASRMPPQIDDGDDQPDRRGSRAAIRRRPVVDRRDGEADVQQRDEQRESLHADDACQLRDRQERHHRVAERNPREAADQDAAQILHRDPHRRGEPESGDAEAANKHRRDRAEDRDVGRHVEREQTRHQHRDDHRKPAEGRHRGAGPVDGTGIVNEAGDQTEREAAPRRRTAQRDQQRHERDEGDRGMAVFRK